MSGLIGRWNPSTIHLILFAIGGFLIYLGDDWGIPGATSIGIAAFGILLLAAGLDVILQRLRVFRLEGWAQVVETYRGLLELLWGLVFMGIGLLIVGVVVVGWLSPATPDTSWQDLLGSPTGIGTILSMAGLMTVLSGLIRLLAGSGQVDPRRLGGIPAALDRLIGAGGVLLGGILSTAGYLMLISPDLIPAALDRLVNLIGVP